MNTISCIPNQSLDRERRRQSLMLFVQTYGEKVFAEQIPGEWLPSRGIRLNPDAWLVVTEGFPDPDVVPIHQIRFN
jgi:hypothetical protein